MRVGDKVSRLRARGPFQAWGRRRRPNGMKLTMGEERGKTVAATVAYIHPKRRFYVAEYIVEPGRPLQIVQWPHRAAMHN